jgi:hypothetical protein
MATLRSCSAGVEAGRHFIAKFFRASQAIGFEQELIIPEWFRSGPFIEGTSHDPK